jgi:hypothetical protein
MKLQGTVSLDYLAHSVDVPGRAVAHVLQDERHSAADEQICFLLLLIEHLTECPQHLFRYFTIHNNPNC